MVRVLLNQNEMKYHLMQLKQMNKILDFEWKWREKNTHTPHGHIDDEQCTSDFC